MRCTLWPCGTSTPVTTTGGGGAACWDSGERLSAFLLVWNRMENLSVPKRFRKIRKHSGGGLDSHAKEIFFCTVPLEVDVEIDKYWEAIGKTTTVVGGRSSVVSDGSDCDPLQLATTGCWSTASESEKSYWSGKVMVNHSESLQMAVNNRFSPLVWLVFRSGKVNRQPMDCEYREQSEEICWNEVYRHSTVIKYCLN